MEKKNYTVAIDLGSNNVVVIVGSRAENGRVHIDDVAVREVEGVVKGEIKNIEQVAKSIKEAVAEIEERLGIRIAEAVTGISGQHIKCARNSCYIYVGRDGEIREDDVQKLRDNMRNVQAPTGETILDFIPLSYLVDDREEVTHPVGMFGQKLEATFNFIIGEENTISRMPKALAKLDIRQSKLMINPLVTAEAVVLPDERDMGVAVVDMGAGTTDVCIYHDNVARHIGIIPIGADAINKDIRAYGILERYVEDLKVKYGSANPETASQDKLIKVPGRTPREPKEISFYNLSTIIEARLKDIFDYVAEEIRRSGFEGRLDAGLVLTGGCAQLKDIDVMAKAYTGMDVRIAGAELHVDDESAEKAVDTRLSTAIGLLLKAMDAGMTSQVETGRKPVAQAAPRPAAPQRPEPVRQADPRPEPKPVRKPDPLEDDTFGEEDFGEDGTPHEPRENPLKKLWGKLTKQFDVIDDEF